LRFTMGLGGLEGLLRNLRSEGYTVLGPKLEDGVVRLSEVQSTDELARGIVDSQSPGQYRARAAGDEIFSAVNGPLSVKNYLHPGEVAVAEIGRSGGKYGTEILLPGKRYAFLGVRPCDLAAVKVLDRSLLVEGFEEPTYADLRKASLIIVVNCGRAGANCFCASMGTGPWAAGDYDIALTELPDRFIVDLDGRFLPLFDGVGLAPAADKDLRDERDLRERVTAGMRKRIESPDPAVGMYEGIDSPVWSEVAERCLACGNCTMVCPTCFCNTTKDITNLADGTVTKVRSWESCLSVDFTQNAGWNPRRERKARYRQFVMHKFAYWTDQSGLYGCVGCGRCITWCPVGIDIAETVNSVLRKGQGSGVREAPRVG